MMMMMSRYVYNRSLFDIFMQHYIIVHVKVKIILSTY